MFSYYRMCSVQLGGIVKGEYQGLLRSYKMLYTVSPYEPGGLIVAGGGGGGVEGGDGAEMAVPEPVSPIAPASPERGA